MVNRPMLWAAENPRLQRRIHNSKLLYGVRRNLKESLAKERYRVRCTSPTGLPGTPT